MSTLSVVSEGEVREGFLWRGVGSERHFGWLKGVVAAIFMMNVLDGLMTVGWVSGGFATEANPMMDSLLAINPGLFMAAKLSLVGLGSVLLWMHRQQPMAVVAIFGIFMIYYFLMMYHMYFVGTLFL